MIIYYNAPSDWKITFKYYQMVIGIEIEEIVQIN